MGLVTKEAVSIIMIALAVLLILSGIAIVILSTMVENGRNVKVVALLGGLIDSLAGLIIIFFSITFLR